ncbi:MAG: glycosyltransferase family 4 protein [Anaerolineales bacterium]|nr:glycosyltransferase family 4 protein [Anaerolineales bacterium]
MHILLIHQAFAALDEPGGTRHHEFARLLAERGHRLTVIASPVSYLTGAPPVHASVSPHFQKKRKAQLEEEQPRGEVRILRARVYSAHHKSFVHRVLAFVSFMASAFFLGLRVQQVDLVWGTSPPIFQGVTAWLLARLKGVPFLFEVRDLWPDFAIAVGVLTDRTLIRMSLWLERFLYHRADRMIVNSPAYVAHVSERGAKQVDLVPNGADPTMFNPADNGAAFRSAHGLTEKFVVLYAGAHGMSNDLGMVLDSASKLAGEPRIQFIFLGDGKEKSGLVARAEEIGLSNVTFLPAIPKRDIPAALAGADACLAILKPIDEYKTTYPNKVFDYMAAGRPVVLVIDGVIREVVEAAGCGVFAQPGDPQALATAVRSLAADKKKARAMGLAGREHLEVHFSRVAIGAKLIRILEEVGALRSHRAQ